MPLTQQQYQKLQGLGLSQSQVNQVVRAGGGLQQNKSLGGFAGNVVKSTGNLIGSTAGAILNPVETIKNLVGIVKDPEILVDYYKQRYGKDLVNTLYEDPAGVAADLSILLTGGGAIASKLGTAGKIGKLSRAGEVASAVGRTVDPFAMAGKASKLAVKPFARVSTKAGESLIKMGETLPTRGMGNPAKMRSVEGVSPKGISNLFEKYKISSRTPEEFSMNATKAGQEYTRLLEEGSAVDIGKIMNDLDHQILALNNKSKTSKSALSAMNELLDRRDALYNAIKNSPTGKAKLATLQEYKTGAQADMPQGAFAQASSPAGVSTGTKKFYQTLIGNIDEGAPGTKNVGREQSALLKLKDIAESSSGRQSVRLPVSPFRLASYGASGVVAGLPGIAGSMLLDYAQTNPKMLIGASKFAKSTGEKLKSGIKLPSMPTQVSKVANTAKALRMVNFPSTEENPISPTIQALPMGSLPKQKEKLPISIATPSPMVQPKRKLVKVGNNPFQKVSKVSKGSFY